MLGLLKIYIMVHAWQKQTILSLVGMWLARFLNLTIMLSCYQINFVVMIMVIKVIIASVTSLQNPGNTSQVRWVNFLNQMVHETVACLIIHLFVRVLSSPFNTVEPLQ